MRRIQQPKDTNYTFKVKLSSSSQTFTPSISKTDSVINVKADVNNQPGEDIYYDEIVYYDGGDAHGYD